METQKITSFLNDSSNEESKFATKKWYVIDNQKAKGKYNQNNYIRFRTETIKQSLCDYSDVAFKECAPFSTCKTETNDVFIDEANNIYIAMHMYILIEYSNNYSDTSGSLKV